MDAWKHNWRVTGKHLLFGTGPAGYAAYYMSYFPTEAMALGTPVISTSKGAEGLEVTPGEDILVADEPAEFADAVLHLLDDRALRTKLVVNGRRLVEQCYSWETCVQRLEQLLCQVAERGRNA